MRKTRISLNEYYHIYNRGNGKQSVFLDARDWARFLFLVIYFQSPVKFFNLGRQVSHYVRHSVFNIPNVEEILKTRTVELATFTLMPNHFHLLVRESTEKGTSSYLQRIQDAYTKYFNTKYKKSGHLFQGPFQAVHIKNNVQLLHLSAYIHMNPCELSQWKNSEHKYNWSSYKDYVGENRWGKLLENQVIMEQFLSPEKYKKFVEQSNIKQLEKEYLLES